MVRPEHDIAPKAGAVALVLAIVLVGAPANARGGPSGRRLARQAVPPAPAEHITLRPHRLGGDPPFLIAGQPLTVDGEVSRYVAGEQVTVRFSRGARVLMAIPAAIAPGAGGRGTFAVTYRSAPAGLITVTAVHAATPQQGAITSAPLRLPCLRRHIHVGAGGPTVRLVQSELHHLHYAVSLSGTFDAATRRAVIAYRKRVGLARVAQVNTSVLRRLQRGRGAFHVRYRHHGRHVEADLSRQLLAEINPGGHVRRIYTVSSGKPSTPTVVGRFRVYSKTPGTNSKGMVDASYFIAGYAIHGYHDVPAHAASHGCLRVPIPDAKLLFQWLRVGDRVDVYSRHHGSHRVRRHGVGP